MQITTILIESIQTGSSVLPLTRHWVKDDSARIMTGKRQDVTSFDQSITETTTTTTTWHATASHIAEILVPLLYNRPRYYRFMSKHEARHVRIANQQIHIELSTRVAANVDRVKSRRQNIV